MFGGPSRVSMCLVYVNVFDELNEYSFDLNEFLFRAIEIFAWNR